MNTPQPGDTIVVWFSCGAASAAAAKLTLEKYGSYCTVRVVNNYIAEEDEDNRRFLRDVEVWLGVTIEDARCSKYQSGSCDDVWKREKYMSGVAGAPCTKYLKKRARQEWEDANAHQWIVMGFCLEEQHRHDRFVKFERSNLLPVLIEAKMTKADCFLMIQDARIPLPRIYGMGYPNANCIGCVKAASASYWNLVRRMHPDVFERRAHLSRELGAKLVRYKGKRMFLDELPSTARSKPVKDIRVECGIFCEL